MLSAIGSIMLPINSLTETTGVISLRSRGGPDCGACGAGFEHCEHARTPRKTIAARPTRRPPTFTIPSSPGAAQGTHFEYLVRTIDTFAIKCQRARRRVARVTARGNVRARAQRASVGV